MGCDPGMAHLDGEELLQNTVRIELVHYENTSPKLIRRSQTNVQTFDFGKVTPIAVLDDSLIEDVVMDMAKQALENGREKKDFLKAAKKVRGFVAKF